MKKMCWDTCGKCIVFKINNTEGLGICLKLYPTYTCETPQFKPDEMHDECPLEDDNESQVEKIKRLRNETGCGLVEVKEALSRRGWIDEFAIEYLKRKGLAIAFTEYARYPKWYSSLNGLEVEVKRAKARAETAEARESTLARLLSQSEHGGKVLQSQLDEANTRIDTAEELTETARGSRDITADVLKEANATIALFIEGICKIADIARDVERPYESTDAIQALDNILGEVELLTLDDVRNAPATKYAENYKAMLEALGKIIVMLNVSNPKDAIETIRKIIAQALAKVNAHSTKEEG